MTSCFPGFNTVRKCVINGVSMAALSTAEQAASNSNTSMLECRDFLLTQTAFMLQGHQVSLFS